jgi:dTMP kinase
LGGPELATGFAEWVRAIELDRFGVPAPDHQVLLATPVDVAASRARDRASSSADRALDNFESDAGLQQRTGAMYAQLAAEGYLSAWSVLTPERDGSVSIPAELAG